MSIQMKFADEIAEKYGDKICTGHIWEKEYDLGASTGDYRCKVCGATIWEGDFEKENNSK